MDSSGAYAPTTVSFRSSHGTLAGELDAGLGDDPSVGEGLPRQREAWERARGVPGPLPDGTAVWASTEDGFVCLPAEAPLCVASSGSSKRDLGCSSVRGKAWWGTQTP